MARIRTIKPDFWRDDDLSEVSAEAALLAIGMLNLADDEGYFNANPKLIEADIFPLRELSGTTTGMISELVRIGYVSIFEGTDGRSYGHVVNFNKHQVINKPTTSAIKGLLVIPDESGSTTVVLPSGRERKGSGKEVEGKGKGKEILSGKPNDAVSVIDHLNKKMKTSYKPVTANLNFINARINEGHSVEELISVVDMKIDEWTDSRFEKYLRPSTLFNAEKFNQYVGALPAYLESQSGGVDWLPEYENVIDGVLAHD